MSFDYSLSADGSQALGVSENVEDSLISIEEHAAKSGFAMTNAFTKGASAARTAHTAFESTVVSLEDVANAYLRINAPLDTLEKELKILDRLQKDGAISAKQYAAELERVGKNAGLATQAQRNQTALNNISLPNTTAAQQNGNPGMNALAVAGGNLMSSAAGMVKDAIVGDINHWAEVKEAETQAANALLKFHDNMEQANNDVERQKRLASDLRVPLQDAVTAYSAVREASQGLHLTTEELQDVTRNLGASMINDGKSMSDVATVMGRFQFAMEKGKLEVMDLKAIARDYPDTMNLMKDATHKTYEQLVQMAKGGELNRDKIAEMVRGMGAADSSMDKLGQRTLTIAEVQKKFGLNVMDAVHYVAEHQGAWERAAPSIAEMIEQVSSKAEIYRDKLNDTTKATHGMIDVTETLLTTLGQLGEKLTVSMGPAFDDYAKRFKQALDLRMGVVNAKAALADLNQSTKDGLLANTQQVQAAREALWATIDPRGYQSWKKIQNDLIEPTRTYRSDLYALNQEFKTGAITVSQYTDEYVKLYQASPKGIEMQRQFAAEVARTRAEIEGLMLAQKTGVTTPAAVGLFGRFANQQQADSTMDAKSLGAFQDKGLADAADIEKQSQAIVEKYGNASTAVERFHASLLEISTVWDSLDEKTQQRVRDNAQLKYWREAGLEAQKAAKMMEKTDAITQEIDNQLKTNVASLSDSLIDAANGADVSWDKFFKNMLVNLEKALAKAALMELIGSSGKGGGGDVPSGLLGMIAGEIGGSFASGGTYTAPRTGGGQDSIPVLFRMNPGETAHFQNPGQSFPSQYNGGPSGGWDRSDGGAMYMTIAPQMYDERALLRAVQGPAGQRVVTSMVRQSMISHVRSFA